mmetsp:Transcript_76015/g.211194  ORF Transcript_76015/g.211194 Transcript_76015/m.211194 type:complete len:304 (-) Transcript_76015:141-1052(-)
MLEVPWVIAAVRLQLDFFAAHVGVRLEDPEAFCRHRGIVVHGDAMKVWVALPIVFQDEEHLLRAPKRKHWHEALPTLPHDLVDRIRKTALPLLAGLVVLDSIRRLHDEHVHPLRWDLRLREVPVLFLAVIASVQHADSSDVDQEHGRAEDVARPIAREFDAPELPLLVVINQLDLVHRLVDVSSAKDLILRCNLADPGIIVPEHAADGSRGVRHEYLALKLRPVHEVWDRARMVEMEMRDEEQIDLSGVNVVEIRQRTHPRVRWVHPAIEHNGLASELHNATRPPDLRTGTQRGDLQGVAINV